MNLTTSPRCPHRVQVLTNSKGYLELNLNNRELRIVPPETFQLIATQVVRLANNYIDYLPTMIAYLRDLRVLDMQHNLLTTLPETLVNCRQLAQLNLTANRLTQLPKSIGGLKKLRILELGENQFDQLPQEVGQLTSLRILDLHGNKLSQLPFSLQELHHLLKLNLNDNMLDHIPLVITKITSLHALGLAKNRLAALPSDFDKLKCLRELNLSGNKFISVSSMLVCLKRLQYLSLASNGLKFLPNQMSELQNLQVLHLQDNSLRYVPGHLKQLRYYNVSRNQLTSFSVEGMRCLVSLTASYNRLEAVPRGLYKLKLLKYLYLDNNKLVELEEDIGRLRQLQVLDLSHNDLASVPQSLYRLAKLHSFNIKENYNLVAAGKGKNELENKNFIKQRRAKATKNGDENFKEAALNNGKMKSEKEAEENKSLKSPRVTLKMNGYGPDMHQRFQTADRERARDKGGNDSHTGTRATDTVNKNSWFNTTRSWRDFLFGRNKHSKSVPSDVGWNPKSTLRSAHSVTFPISYSVDQVEGGRVNHTINKRKPRTRVTSDQSDTENYKNYNSNRKQKQRTKEKRERYVPSYSLDDREIFIDYKGHNHQKRKGRASSVSEDTESDMEEHRSTRSHHKEWSEDIEWTEDESTPRHYNRKMNSPRKRKPVTHTLPRASYSRKHRENSPRMVKSDHHFTSHKSRTKSHSHVDKPHRNKQPRQHSSGQDSRERIYRYQNHGSRERGNTRNQENGSRERINTRYHESRERINNEDQYETYESEVDFYSSSDDDSLKSAEYHTQRRDTAQHNNNNLRHGPADNKRPHHTKHPNYDDSSVEDFIDYVDVPENRLKIKGESIQGIPYKQMKVLTSQFDHVLSTNEQQENSTHQPPNHHDNNVNNTGLNSENQKKFDNNFTMKKKPNQLLSRSLDSLLDTSNDQPFSNKRQVNSHMIGENGTFPQKRGDAKSDNSGVIKPSAGTDYTLLGVCNQIETLLNKNLLQPVIGYSNNRGQRFSDKTIIKNATGLWRIDSEADHRDMGGDVNEDDDLDLEYGQPRTFVVTTDGGQFVSDTHPGISVNIPAHSLSNTLHVTIQLLFVSPKLIKKAQKLNHFVSNIITMGPIVYFKTSHETSFDSPVTITMPAPLSVKGGHLTILTIRKDNSCIPCANGFYSGKATVTLNAWHLYTKVALITKAKCKYKACKSVEQFLQVTGISKPPQSDII